MRNGPWDYDKELIHLTKKRLNGICMSCTNEVVIGKAYCQEHLDYEKERAISRKIKAKKLGNCTGCYKNIAKYSSLCERCWFKQTAQRVMGTIEFYDDLWILLEKQNFKCAYSGLIITPGVNASVDHIIPSSKGGTNDLSNLVWCDFNINLLKRDLTAKQFLNFCRLVVNYAASNPDHPAHEIIDNRYKSPTQMWFDFDED